MEEKDQKRGGILTAQEQEKQIEQSRRKHDRIAIAVVIVLAILFWLFVRYTQMGNYEQTISDIRVEIRNAGKLSEAAVGGYVTIVVKGERSVVELLTKDNIKAYVDASEVKGTGASYPLPVQIEGVPQDVTIVSQSVTSLILFLEQGGSSASTGA